MEMPSKLVFADEKIKDAFEKLESGKYEEKWLYKFLKRAFEDIEQNAFCGINMPKKLIPAQYVSSYAIDNLWKYDLPNGWRLLYSIAKKEVIVVSIVLEWFDHKKYERRFGY